MGGYRPNDNKGKRRNKQTVGPTEDQKRESEQLEADFGFERINEGGDRLGWLMNMQPSDMQQADSGITVSAVNLYFIQQDGATFKISLANNPYFYIAAAPAHFAEVEAHLKVRYQRHIHRTVPQMKEDLDLRNHLSGLKRRYLRVEFHTINDLLHVRGEIMPHLNRNKAEKKVTETYSLWETTHEDNEDDYILGGGQSEASASYQSPLTHIDDLREADVPFYIRTAIDRDIRVGFWYNVSFLAGNASLTRRTDLLQRADPRVFAFDIETTKLPLKFPDADIDSVMMISYMADGQGYLIINRECVSEDVEDFEYTPKPEFEGPFTIFNETTEVDLLRRFFDHIRELKPNVFVTFNGDFFDWPFVDARAALHGMNMSAEIGVFKNSSGEYRSRFASHLDAYKWVVRDSYLPVGSQGLKAVTKAKLGYDPVEVDPEDMVQFALDKPQVMASYSVSDAVATYYLYMKYVHPFIFSLCTIIPMNPDDVLRKGSGTLCETLLMVEAFAANIIFPNKQRPVDGKLHKGHQLESETYVGGHVEALESGVFRSDLPERFELDPAVFQQLIDQLDNTLRYTIEVEEGMALADVTNYDQIRADILSQLVALQGTPDLKQCPQIYHLDVGAMYPNIILTNRLQPSSIVSNEDCAACDYNSPANGCQRPMQWTWRGDYIPASSAEYRMILGQLEGERFKPVYEEGFRQPYSQLPADVAVPYSQLPKAQQGSLLTARLKDYSKKVYGKTHVVKEEVRVDTVCQRENPFYVDTVRAFRDRRYTYKSDLKKWKGNLDKALRQGDMETIQEAKDMNVLYDSLQLAHKCILNSFYGYVMRRGARWFSMEMAGIVTYNGAQIIKRAREVLDGVGKPLELDTDGIWTLLPNTFPENFKFDLREGASKRNIVFSYPCVMLNYRVRDQFTNEQYQTLNPATGKYETVPECSIFFEVDGPYRAMILPASTEEGKKLKKRYAVFNNDAEGSLAELKGFEIKRRGELKLIKHFQSQVFKTFLKGDTIAECYAAVAKVADHWLDILYGKGQTMIDVELLKLISCSSNMSRKLADYGAQKSTAITTAKRLAEFLGNQIVKEAGLACEFIVASRPVGAPTTERAIPVAIFSAEPAVCAFFLQKWLGVTMGDDFDVRDIIDWEYYINRVAGTIRKIITIPAALQKVPNPVPRLPHPVWLLKKIDQSSGRQLKIQFAKKDPAAAEMMDIENIGLASAPSVSTPSRPVARVTHWAKSSNPTSTPAPAVPEVPLHEQPQPNKEEDFDGWMAWSKARWRQQRRERNNRKRGARPMSMSPGAPPSKRRTTTNNALRQTGLLAKQQAALYESRWEVIQVVPLENSPGEFRVWTLIDDLMYPVQLSVPHIFFIHSRTKNPSNIESLPNVQLVENRLPHSKPTKFLYRLQLTELQYQKHNKDVQALASLSDVEGIYETQVPSLFRALIQLGCLCRFSDGRDAQALVSTWEQMQVSSNHMNFSLHQLKRLEKPAPGAYLANSDRFKLCFLYSSHTESRSLYCLVLPNTKVVHMFFVSALSKNSTPNIEALYEKYLPGFEFHVRLFKHRPYAVSQMNELVNAFKKAHPGPAVFLAQGASTDPAEDPTAASGENSLWKALREFPVVALNGNQQDNQYPAFGWEGYCVKLVASRFQGALDWFQTQADFCRYAQIPIGNLTRDYPIQTADLSFSRSLASQKHLLWISPTTFPDLGAPCYSHSALIDEIRYPERCRPSCLTSVTVSLQLRNLALNTILQSHHVNDIEHIHSGKGGQSSFGGKEAAMGVELLDDSLQCFPAFRVLKQLVSQWTLDLDSKVHNKFADVLLDHIYRWLSSPTSVLYDPALLHYVHSLMKKVFLQLLAEFKSLGATVVFASFNQLIISTPKHTAPDAITYTDFALQSIKKKKLFSWLNIEVAEYWEAAMFLDQANYCAMVVDPETLQAECQSKWDMAQYLPENLQPAFTDVITDYTERLHALFHHPQESSLENRAPPNVDDDGPPSDPKKQGRARKMIVRDTLTPRLFNLVHDAQHNMATVQQATTKSPSLQFIQYICKILSLDATIAQEIVKLQKNLFKLAQVREFSKEAEFTNPSECYVLYDVMCQFCSSVVDIDLLRDPRLSEGDWTCQHCHHEYDKVGVEKRLIDILKRKSLAYQLQDVVCDKCNLVKEDNTSMYCKNCSGKFVPCLKPADVEKFVRRFHKISEVHHLDWLQEVSAWMIESF